MAKQRTTVSLVTDIEEIAREMVPQPVLMVRPKLNRKYAHQQMSTTAEVVDLSTLNLAKMRTFEIL